MQTALSKTLEIYSPDVVSLLTLYLSSFASIPCEIAEYPAWCNWGLSVLIGLVGLGLLALGFAFDSIVALGLTVQAVVALGAGWILSLISSCSACFRAPTRQPKSRRMSFAGWKPTLSHG
jgi:hypothetical protein